MAKKNWEAELIAEVLNRADPSWMGTEYWEFQAEIGGMRFTILGKRGKKSGQWKMMGWHDGWSN